MKESSEISASKKRVQAMFGANAEAYVTSAVHAKGWSLQRLVEIVEPQISWRILDVATAAGHMAHTLAPYVRFTVASDITFNMLLVAAEEGRGRGLDYIPRIAADAEALPFESEKFDLITCRIATHHFPVVSRFMSEAARVLVPGGVLAIVDNVVPGSHLRGKKAQLKREAGRYVNAFEQLRDPSHVRCLSLDEWQQQFYENGFLLIHQETAAKPMDLDDWAARMKASLENIIRLRVMLRQAPGPAAEFLRPRSKSNRFSFTLREAILVGTRVQS